ncbi:MAG TPA: hypothetical protein VL688_05975 [Verrucomicrobiae bacterium]|nr:hypothetical protein [Verrucomicrobiae bacterium]
MKKYLGFFVTILFFMTIAAVSAHASLDQAVATVGEGAVQFPVGLVKLVGGILWTVGEVIALPFNMIF